MSGWNLACLDWEDRIRAGRSLVPDLPLNIDLADRAAAIFDLLQLSDVPGNPSLAEAAGDWARDIIRAAFGSWFPEKNERFIREIFALVGKKNSKTTYLGAGMGLTWLLENKRPRALGLLIAPTQDITEIAYGQVEGMIRLDEELLGILHIQNHMKTVTNRRTGATLEVMSFDPNVLTGQKPAFWMLDELHLVSKSPKARSALGQLRGGMISMPEAFGVIITTQSETQPAGVMKAELEKARAVRDGRSVGGYTLPILYEFPPAIAKDRDAWRDAKNWPMVVPNNGRSITVGRLVEEYSEAEKSGEEELRRWASQHLNIEIGVALGSERWAGADFWEESADPTLTLETLLERCEVATIGADGGGLEDLFGLAVIGREKITRRWLSWCKAWCNISVLVRRKSEAQRLIDFAIAGQLVVVDALGPIAPGEIAAKLEDESLRAKARRARRSAAADEAPPPPADIAGIVAIVRQVDAAGILSSIGLDRAGLGSVVDALAEAGFGGEKELAPGERSRVEAVPQTFRLSDAINTIGRKLADGTMDHADQALMAWCVGNAKAELKSNSIMITKQAAGAAKIDPLMALFDAAHLMGMNPNAIGGPSVYEEHGLMVI